VSSSEDNTCAHHDLHPVMLRMVPGGTQVQVMSPQHKAAPLFGALLALTSCQGIANDAAARPVAGGAWTTVLETDAVTVAIDTASAVRWWNDTYAVLVRSDHLKPRARDGRAWDREVAK
jgi:hypothetical protein